MLQWSIRPFLVARAGRALLTLLMLGLATADDCRGDPGPATPGTVLVQARDFQGRLRGEEALLAVPENRSEAASRIITVHYFRFPARQPAGLPPVFILPGGPGDSYLAAEIQSGLLRQGFSAVAEMEAYNETRDVVVVNQRGNSTVPGIQSLPAVWEAPPGKSSEPLSFASAAVRLAAGFKLLVKKCEATKIDLRGYDILHLVDDVEAIRKAYGYEKIALRGTSFGSQWALAYLKRYPDRVDRMILAGVEPLDHGYDSADGIWNVFQRIEHEALAQKSLALPEGGLLGAIKEIITRLEKKPVRIRGQHPTRGAMVDVVIGPDDFRHYLRRPILDAPMHSRRMLELWPEFVLEIYRKDYRYLASKIIDDRPEVGHHPLLGALIDSSLGITDQRRKRLRDEQAFRWLGDINWHPAALEQDSPTKEVSDEFRRMVRSEVPVLMIHGTLDLATPIENAQELAKWFPRGHLLTIHGGTHAATHHAASVEPKFLQCLATFMDAVDPQGALQELPADISLPPLAIKVSGGPSLFEELTSRLPRAEK